MTTKSMQTNLESATTETSRRTASGLAKLAAVRAPQRGSFINPDG